EATAEPDVAIGVRADVARESGDGETGKPPRPEGRRDVRLQRTLVFAEARVTVDAVERIARGDEVGGEVPEVPGQPVDDRQHRRPDVPLVIVLPGPEPLAVVVARETPEKREGLRG